MEEPDTGQNHVQQRVKTGSARLREIRENLVNSKTKPTTTSTTADVFEQMTTTSQEIGIVASHVPEINEEKILLEEANWTRINTEPPEFSTVRNLKLALGAIGGIAILLGCVCSLLYISRQKRRQQARAQKRSPANNKFPGSNQPPNALNPAYPPHYFNPSHLYPQTQAQGPLGAPHGIPEWSQVPPQLNGGSAFAGMQVQYDLAQQYPEAYLEHFRQQGLYDPYYAVEYYQQFYQQHQQQAYPESQAEMSEIAFDPVLNYVETIGEGLKTPKRRPKQRKDGSSTPHPIITRRASFKSVRSEVSAWTEDEGELGRKSPCERGEMRRGSEELEGERTPKGDSAYGSRGSIQSPHSIHELTGVSDDEKVPDGHVVRFSSKVTTAETNEHGTSGSRELAVE